MSFHSELRRLARRLKVRLTNDPEGVNATLNIAARLVSDGWTQGQSFRHPAGFNAYDIDGAIGAAVELAASKDPVRTFWAAYAAVRRQLPAGYRTTIDYNDADGRTQAECVELIKSAAKSHGALMKAQRKGTKA